MGIRAGALQAAAGSPSRGAPAGPLRLPVSGCEGRGCGWRGLEAAAAFYSARRAGIPARPSEYYNRPPLFVPKQSFHNSLNRLLGLLGHSPLFKRVLYGGLGCLVCRRPDGSVLWEHYGPGDPPACPGPCALEEWPGPRPPSTFTWREGVMSARLTTEWNVYAVAARLKAEFGGEWFTASRAAGVLLISTQSAARLLRALEELGIVESVREKGRNMKRYRVTR